MAFCAACTAATPNATPRCIRCGKEHALVSPRGERYRLLRSLGSGPGRKTWQALRESDGLAVVVKETSLPRCNDKLRELVYREATVLFFLDHPQIPSLAHHWITEGSNAISWLVLEYIEGTDLESWLSVRPFEEAEVVEVLRELCLVLAYLHSRSPPVLHRDLKPANVMRRVDGRLALLDFGAAREGIAGQAPTTVVGTWGYMAPEQFEGRATRRSDVYGLGALAVGLLTGRELPALQAGGGWQEHASVSPALGALLSEMLAHEPSARPPSADAVRERLDALPAERRAPSAATVLLATAVIAWSMVLLMLLGTSSLALIAAASLAAR